MIYFVNNIPGIEEVNMIKDIQLTIIPELKKLTIEVIMIVHCLVNIVIMIYYVYCLVNNIPGIEEVNMIYYVYVFS